MDFLKAMSRYYNGSVLTTLIFNEEIKSLKEDLPCAISGMMQMQIFCMQSIMEESLKKNL